MLFRIFHYKYEHFPNYFPIVNFISKDYKFENLCVCVFVCTIYVVAILNENLCLNMRPNFIKFKLYIAP